MSKFFLPILLVVGFGLWKVLDHLQLPNTFSILLILLTALSGILWCYHRFSAIPRRKRQIARLEQRSGKELTAEEKAKVEEELAFKYERWEYLNELAAQIEENKKNK